MAYFRTYTYSFVDNHNVHPANWRVDILDGQANAGTTPINLTPGAEPLILERVNTSDDKATKIIGRQATLSYEYTGATGIPLPELFFDTDERRFRVEIYKNNVLYDVFYIKPDACEYDYKASPYTVKLTAVDGLSFLKSVPWNAYTEDRILDYRWMTLYEIIMDRGVFQVLDSDIAVNVINTLRPENVEGDASFLNDLYVHSDMFIDFTKGPDDVYMVLEKICQQFYLRLFIAQNQVWIVRVPDLLQTSITAENYILGVLNNLDLPTIHRQLGPNEASYDGVPVDFDAKIVMYPAIKQVEFNIEYRSINRLDNFTWANFDGTDFSGWIRQTFADQVSVYQRDMGVGLFNRYRAGVNYGTGIADGQGLESLIGTAQPVNKLKTGDILEIEVPYEFFNSDKGNIYIDSSTGIGGKTISLSGDGSWMLTSGFYKNPIPFNRGSKYKKTGSIKIKSQPLPVKFPTGEVTDAYFFQIVLGPPTEINDFDGDHVSSIEYQPVKAGIINTNSNGRSIRDVNNARYSQKTEAIPAYFLDTGLATLSNTVGIDDEGTPAENWAAIGAPTDKQDLERHMADANVDQYAKSVRGWQGNIKSNTIEFWHLFSLTGLPGIKLVQMPGNYNVRTCTHEMDLQEILPENGAQTTYEEFDIDDTE